MTKEKTKTVFPGDFITTEEEFVAGRNTYEENGEVKAAIIGEVDFDDEYKEVNVRGKGVPRLKSGDIVIGKVVKKREKMITLQILGTEERRAIILGMAQIPVRNASQAFVEDMRNLYKLGDFVRAKVVVSTKMQVDLATNEKGLGVVDARCTVCKTRLNFNNGKMTCLACGNVEERKWFDAEDVRGERPPRRDDRGGRSFGGRDSRGGDRRPSGGFGGRRDDRRDSRGGRDSGRSFGGNRDRSSSDPRDSSRSFGGDRRDSRGGDRRPSSGGRGNFNRDRNDSRGGFRNENRDNRSRQRRN